MDIAQLGYSVDSSELTQGTVALDKHAVAAGRTGTATTKLEGQSKRLALSQRELLFAQRQLPMQFTDIFTSVQAGQNPMQVFLQQGGQLKDTFGGVGPALRASAGYIMGLVNPLTVAAGVAGGLAVAWHAAEQRNAEFNKSIILTGNYVGTTTEQMAAMAAEMDALAGVTEGSASEALAKVAASGRFTGEQFALVGQAAEQMRATAGIAIDETVDKFEAIAKDPVEALLKLNETEHFLTQSQLDRVQALQQEGREQEAVTEAVRIYGRESVERANAAAEAMASIPSLWRQIKTGAMEAGDAVVNWAGDVDVAMGHATNRFAAYRAEQRGAWREAVDFYAKFGTLFGGGDAFAGVTATVDTTGAVEGAIDSDAVRDRMEAEEELADRRKKWFDDSARYGSEREQMETEILRIKAEGLELDLSREEIERRVGSLRQDYAEKEAKALASSSRARERLDEAARREHYRATKEAMDLRKQEQADLQKLIETEDQANQSFLQLSATLSGPLAAAEYQHIQNLAEINRLGKAAGRTSAEIAEAKRLEGEAYDKLVDKIERESNSMSEFAKQAARNMQSYLGDNLYDVLSGKFDQIGDRFADMIKRMLAEAATAKALEAFGGWASSYTGTGSGFVNAIGGALQGDGGREYGGSVYRNGMYRTGERNKPELLSTPNGQYLIPGDNGRVDPVRAVTPARGAGMGTPQININVSGNANVESATARPNGSGGFDVDMIFSQIEKGIASNIGAGASPINSALQGRYGMRPAV